MAMKRYGVIALTLLVAAVIGWKVIRELQGAQLVDDCIAELSSAVASKQRPRIRSVMSGDSLTDLLYKAKSVEMAYARPKNEKWARAGFVVQTSQDGAKPRMLGLLLDREKLPQCQFIRDYGDGAFGAHGRDEVQTASVTKTSSATQ
jgi:hypothetical protein